MNLSRRRLVRSEIARYAEVIRKASITAELVQPQNVVINFSNR